MVNKCLTLVEVLLTSQSLIALELVSLLAIQIESMAWDIHSLVALVEYILATTKWNTRFNQHILHNLKSNDGIMYHDSGFCFVRHDMFNLYYIAIEIFN